MIDYGETNKLAIIVDLKASCDSDMVIISSRIDPRKFFLIERIDPSMGQAQPVQEKKNTVSFRPKMIVQVLNSRRTNLCYSLNPKL